MKNFDEARAAKRASEDDRTFQLGGETFVALPSVHPDVLAAYDKIKPETSITETMEVVDEVIIQLIDPRDDSAGRYTSIRANKTDPLSVDDLLELVKWLMAQQTGRPTGQSSDSGSGLTSTETSSTDDFSSPVTPTASPVLT